MRLDHRPAVLIIAAAALFGGTTASAQRGTEELAESLRAAVDDSIHRLVQGRSCAWTGPNPAQGMTSTFTAEGVRIAGGEAQDPWSLELALMAFGRQGALEAAVPSEPEIQGRIARYRRGSLTESYVNGASGLEQGFTIQDPPPGAGALQLVLATGGLAPEILPDGAALLVDPELGPVLRYGEPWAWDSAQRELEAWLSLTDGRLSISVDDDGARYPVFVDPLIAAEEAKLLAGDGGSHDHLGQAVSLSGDTVVVGLPAMTSRPASMPARPTCSCAAEPPGASSRSSPPATRRPATISAFPSRSPGKR